MNGRAYYNEFDPFAAAWLRELIADGLIPAGDVDERSIVDVQPGDVRGYTACHWFAGIGGWALALQLAGWPRRSPVWTGSCPCQPLSSAGRRQGDLDERHLWPAFHRLIAQCQPPMVFGEQVASKDGREWFSAVRIDLEHLGYACGAADLCAAGVGAPHIRQRLFWCARDVADAAESGRCSQPIGTAGTDRRPATELGRLRDPLALANGIGPRLEGRDARALGHEREAAERGGEAGGLGDADREGQRECAQRDRQSSAGCEVQRRADAGRSGHWSELEWLSCRDGKARPTKPGLLPLASRVPNRVGTLRGAGNAIVAQLGAEFIQVSIEALQMTEVAA